MRILVKYASRSRPERFREGLESIVKLASFRKNITILCVIDQDDDSMKNIQLPIENCNYFVYIHSGLSTSKIDAINRPIPEGLKWNILVNFSDDMKFTVHGWDVLIHDAIISNGPDVFLHFPDSTAKSALPTMSVMDRAYFERDGYIYHPSYKSLWCDNEAMEVAKIRGRYVYIDTQIFDHYHPSYGKAEWDEQYYRQQAFWNEDEDNYKYRKANNFFLDAENIKHIDSNS